MGIYSNTVSISQFRISGELPDQDLFNWLQTALAGRSFKSIEQSAEETAEGWVHTDNPDYAEFTTPDTCWRDRYLFFTYRRDQRKIPSALLKSHISRAEKEYLARRPEMKRPPKSEREEISERVKLSLLARTLPAPVTVDLVWQPDKGLVTLFSTSQKVIERFEELFNKSFENLRPLRIYPYKRAFDLLDENLRERLVAVNQAPTEAALDEIQCNIWIGQDFLLWLLNRGLEGESFRTCTEGHLETGTPFSAWIDDKIHLQGGGESGLQKVAVSGSQDRYLEARTALKSGKTISSAVIHLEKDDLQWRFSLNGDMFTFGSFKSPSVKIERDGGDQISELESVFYERLYLLESGLQMFDSLLVCFLKQRLGDEWTNCMSIINAWLED